MTGTAYKGPGWTARMAWVFACLMLVLITTPGLLAQTQMPAFEDYAIPEKFEGKSARLILDGVDDSVRDRLRLAAKRKPNFAGHYILTVWECGPECLTGYVIDAKTGRAYDLPFTLCCWTTETDSRSRPIDFRINSKLIIFQGGRNAKACDWGTHYYKFESNHFDLIVTTSKLQCP